MRRVKTRKALREAERTLKASPAIDHWQKGRERIEAEELLDFSWPATRRPTTELPGSVRREFDGLIARRATGEPVPLITGHTDFLGLDIAAEPGVFVPRDSSEFLAIQAIRRLKRRTHPVHVDLATGGGPSRSPSRTVSRRPSLRDRRRADAVKLARKNAKHLGLKATFRTGDLFGGLPAKIAGHVDVITLHPPYVPVGEIEDLPDEVRAFEPVHTLTDGSVDGMGLVRRTAEEGPRWLNRGGLVVDRGRTPRPRAT